MSDKHDTKPLNLLLIGAGSMFTSMVVAGFLVGYWIDTWFDTQPIGLMVCGVMGFIGGGRKVYDVLMKMPS
jgi:ATP synthase protein I